MKAAAAKASLFLSVLFLAVYGATNWITGQRTNVGTWYFEWERAIPFVPFMIVPYMSIDLFFVVAPFLCSDKRELGTFSRRITFAIIATGVCFLLVPMRFAFERPESGGWLGTMFGGFRMLDGPYNLIPSLHITLSLILVDLYGKHTRGLVRLAMQGWFVLVGLSAVLTYQHHVVDIAGGLLLGALCWCLFPAVPSRRPVMTNSRVGSYYGLGAAVALFLAAMTQPWGYLLLWPGLALAVVAAAYSRAGPGMFLKRGGRLARWWRFVLWPVLLGQHLSHAYYRRQSRPWNTVVPRLLIGRKLNKTEAAEACRQGVSAVLDLTAEFSEVAPFLAMTYRNLPILDLTAPSPQQLHEAIRFISEQRSRGTVYVHCKIGYSRSATVVGAYLLAIGRVTTAEEAVEHLRKVRPGIAVRPEAWSALRAFEDSHGTRTVGRSIHPSFCEVPLATP
jgi:protein-tyrosine phosphatase